MIHSIHNPKVQLVRKLQTSSRTRREEKSFVIEGVRLVEEAFKTAQKPKLVFYTGRLKSRGMDLINQFSQAGTPTYQVDENVMRTMSDTQTPQGILAVFPFIQIDYPKKPGFILIPDSIRDPGNLGTILRSALAAGVDLVILPRGSVDYYSPKVVRSAMGAHFHLPLRQLDWDSIPAAIAHTFVYLAEANGDLPYFNATFTKPITIIIGGEAQGASAQARSHANETIRIPMTRSAESLNAAVAAAIVLFEVVRQRQATHV